MNTGIIASRYARALLLYVQETGEGERVCAQAARLEQALAKFPDLSALETALGGEKMAPALERFIRLVIDRGRMPLLRQMLHDFIDAWYRSQRILHATLTTVVPPGDDVLDRIRDLVRRRTGCDVVIATSLDPGLIGGFVFEIEDYTLDGSAARQLRRIRRQFIENNRRIV